MEMEQNSLKEEMSINPMPPIPPMPPMPPAPPKPMPPRPSPDEICIDPKPMVGYAYVKPQNLTEVYDEEKALKVGTIFPELNIPYGKYEVRFMEV